MKKIPFRYMIVFAAAIALLVFSTVKSAQALPTYVSGEYTTEFKMYHIGVALWEGSEIVNYKSYNSGDETWHVNSVEDGTLFRGKEDALGAGETVSANVHVSNMGSIDEYVRLVIYKYWTDGKGNKQYGLDPRLIHMDFQGEKWLLDETNSTEEMYVLYYTEPLSFGEDPGVTSDLTIMLSLDGEIKKEYSVIEVDTTTLEYRYKYDGMAVRVEIEADGVQEHNAQDAIKAAWGREVSISDSLSGSGLTAVGTGG
ncbi:MAG: hypothetical protein IJ091_01215 [Oscillospiraceae bacterium]|nr:hypothetical protein [Oscillospiraceae bacterium]